VSSPQLVEDFNLCLSDSITKVSALVSRVLLGRLGELASAPTRGRQSKATASRRCWFLKSTKVELLVTIQICYLGTLEKLIYVYSHIRVNRKVCPVFVNLCQRKV